MSKNKIVQTKNPRTGHYVKINRLEGKIVGHKSTKGPYKGIPVIRKSK